MKTISSLTNADSRNQSSGSHDISRRSFLVTGATGGAALLTEGLASLFRASSALAKDSSPGNAPWIEATIPQLQALMATGQLSDPPDAGICDSLPKKPHVFTGKAHLPHGRIF